MAIVPVIFAAVLSTSMTLAPGAADPEQKPAIVRPETSATVVVEAPVYLKPDAGLKPLRMLPVGTNLFVERVEPEWLHVTFNDRQFGRRTGWIQRKFTRINEPPAATPAEPATPQRPTAPVPRRQAPRPAAEPIGIRGFGTAAADWMSAEESFKAITGSDRATSFGGGVQVTNLWRGLFAEVSAERTTRDGERVFITGDDEVFPLGIPLRIKITPVDLVGGWRSRPYGRAVTYGGAGVTFVKYEETSDFAADDENVDEDGTGFVLMGGIEVRLIRWVHVRGEARYRRIDDVLGTGGASAAFEETRLGGFGGGLKIVVGR